MTKDEFIELVEFSLLGCDQKEVAIFLEYWCESSLNGKKMRFQGEKYFDVKRRFRTWTNNSKKFNPVKSTLTPIEATLVAYEKAKGNMGL